MYDMALVTTNHAVGRKGRVNQISVFAPVQIGATNSQYRVVSIGSVHC